MEKVKRVELSIIILTYNSLGFIEGCLNSVYKYNDLPEGELEIIVVDNSDAVEGQKIKTLLSEKYPSVRFIKNKNLGYGQGNNVGIKEARGRIVSVMNPDVELVEPLFRKVLNQFAHHPKLAMLGGKQIGRLDISTYFRPEKEIFILTLVLGVLCNRLNYYNPHLMFLSGAFLFLDKAKFEEIGLFDENLFLYCEEPDITIRFLKRGYTTYYDKSFRYNHLIGDRDDFSEFTFQESIKSINYYFKKHNFNLSFYYKQKKISYFIKYQIHKLLGQKDKAETSFIYYHKYRDTYRQDIS